MKLPLVAYVLPGLLVLAAVPLTMGKVPPNGLYGLRTPKTLASREIWYPANRFAGKMLMVAGALTIAVNLFLWQTHPDWPVRMLLRWMAADLLIWVLLACAVSLGYLRKL